MKKIPIILGAALLVVCAALLAVTYAPIFPWNKAAEVEAAAPSEETTDEEAIEENVTVEKSEIEIDLTVDPNSPLLDVVKEFAENPVASKNSYPEKAKERLKATGLSDAVSFPFEKYEKGKTNYSDEDIEAMYDELVQEILSNVPFGAREVQRLAEIKINGETVIADCNPWMDEFLEVYETVGNHGFTTHHSNYWRRFGIEAKDPKAGTGDYPYPTGSDLDIAVDDNGEKIWYVTEDYLDVMNKVLILFDRFERTNVEVWNTNDHDILNLATDWVDVRILKNEDEDYFDNGPVLTFSYRLKDNSFKFRFGHNLLDKRFEVYQKGEKAKVVKKTPKKTPTTPNTPPPTKKNPDPDPDPDPDPGDPPKPGVTPKDPTKDPVNNGNADKGGGQNDPANNEDPKDREKQPNQGHQDPSSVTPATPSKDADHKDTEVDKTNEEKMDYTPDTPNGENGVTWTDNADPSHQETGSTSPENGEFTPDD